MIRKLSRMPGIRWLRDELLLPTGKGSWLYTRDVVHWAALPELKTQLPEAFATFSDWCETQSQYWGPVLGGKRVFELAMEIHRANSNRPIRLQHNGRVVYLEPNDPRMLQVPNEVFWETPISAVISQRLSPGDTFLDIGANHGSYSIHAGHVVGKEGRVIAFEPQPNLADLVKCSLNEIEGLRFEVIEDACGEREAVLEFFAPTESSGAAGIFASFSAEGEYTKYDVEVRPLDDILKNRELPGNLFVKLDVEGSELSVLKGAKSLLKSRKPDVLMELNPQAMEAAGSIIEDFIQFFGNMGYQSVYCCGSIERITYPLNHLLENDCENVLFLNEVPGIFSNLRSQPFQ